MSLSSSECNLVIGLSSLVQQLPAREPVRGLFGSAPRPSLFQEEAKRPLAATSGLISKYRGRAFGGVSELNIISIL